MPTFPFKGPPSSRPISVESPDCPAKWPPNGDSKERAVAQLLHHGVLSHTVGRGMEHKVRTTIVTRQGWQYRCDVFCHDKPMKWAFFPVVVDRTSQIRHVGTAPESMEALRLNLAEEAVGVHFTRCAVLREYLTLASIYSQPPAATKRRYSRSVLLVGVALLTAYGVWSQTLRTRSGQTPVGSPAVSQQAPHPVTVQIPAPAPEPDPLPPANNTEQRRNPCQAICCAGSHPGGQGSQACPAERSPDPGKPCGETCPGLPCRGRSRENGVRCPARGLAALYWLAASDLPCPQWYVSAVPDS